MRKEADNQEGEGHQQDRPQRKLVIDKEEKRQIADQRNRIGEELLDGGQHRVLHLLGIVHGAGNRIAATFLREVAQRKGNHLIVQLIAQAIKKVAPHMRHHPLGSVCKQITQKVQQRRKEDENENGTAGGVKRDNRRQQRDDIRGDRAQSLQRSSEQQFHERLNHQERENRQSDIEEVQEKDSR